MDIEAGAVNDLLENNHDVGQLDVGWDAGITTGIALVSDSTYCLYAEGDAATPENEIECVELDAGTPIGGDAGIFFSNIPTGSYYITWDGGDWGTGTTEPGAYDPQTDATVDGDVVDIAGAEGYGTLIPGQLFDLLFTQSNGGIDLASGYVAALTVQTAAGALVEVELGDCFVNTEVYDSDGEVTGGDGEAVFPGLVAGDTYCIDVFDAVGGFVAEQPITLGSGSNTEGVATGPAWAVVTVEHWVGCTIGAAVYGNYAITANSALRSVFTPTAGSVLATAIDEDGVCDSTLEVTNAIANIRSAAVFNTILSAELHFIDTSGNAYFLLPVGTAFHQASAYVEDSVNAY